MLAEQYPSGRPRVPDDVRSTGIIAGDNQNDSQTTFRSDYDLNRYFSSHDTPKLAPSHLPNYQKGQISPGYTRTDTLLHEAIASMTPRYPNGVFSPMQTFPVTPKNSDQNNVFVFPDVAGDARQTDNINTLSPSHIASDKHMSSSFSSDNTLISTTLGIRPISSVYPPPSPNHRPALLLPTGPKLIENSPNLNLKDHSHQDFGNALPNSPRSPYTSRCTCGDRENGNDETGRLHDDARSASQREQRDVDRCRKNLFTRPQSAQNPSISDDVINLLTSRGILNKDQANLLASRQCINDVTEIGSRGDKTYQVIIIPRISDSCQTDDVMPTRYFSSGHVNDGYMDCRSDDRADRNVASPRKRAWECTGGSGWSLSPSKHHLADDLRRFRKKSKPKLRCECDDFERHVITMARRAYQKVRRRNGSKAAFDQFRREVAETNAIVLDSLRMLRDIKSYCDHCAA